MTDDQTPLDLDAIRERLRLWEEELDRNWTASADLLEEAAFALDVGPLLREVERVTAERDQLRTEVAATAYHESHNPCDVCTHMQVEDLVLDVETVTGERDRARDLAAALEAELETARASETRWLTEVALRATCAWRYGMGDEYEIALLDVLTWWLEDRRAIPQPEVCTWWRTKLRNWAGKVTEAHERGDTLDERTLLALWEHARHE